MRKLLVAVTYLLFGQIGHAGNVAVIDSGIDKEHAQISDVVWSNPKEIPGNGIDDDNNGFIDDFHGWNFGNNNHNLIDYRDEEHYSEDIAKFMDIQARSLMGATTKGEVKWAVSKLEEEGFVTSITAYGQYAHGTHVAGLMTRNLETSKLIDIRIMPQLRKEQQLELMAQVSAALDAEQDVHFILEFVIKGGLSLFARATGQIFENIALYLDAQDVRVANASVGMGINQARGFLTPILNLVTGGKADEELVDEYAVFFLKEAKKAQQKAFAKAENTLFVFASGNDGIDNDVAPTLPASISLLNTLSVGASIGNSAIAPFSSYGAASVDLFAPGVGIESAVPMDKTMSMTGTSQAAPMVANIAALILEANPKLTVTQVKKTLMSTIDRKEFLVGKAYTEGTLNKDRALMAATLSLEMPLKEALLESHRLVADLKAEKPDISMPVLIGKPLMGLN